MCYTTFPSHDAASKKVVIFTDIVWSMTTVYVERYEEHEKDDDSDGNRIVEFIISYGNESFRLKKSDDHEVHHNHYEQRAAENRGENEWDRLDIDRIVEIHPCGV